MKWLRSFVALASLVVLVACLPAAARAADRVYWANYTGNKISLANLDGSGGADLNTGVATVSNPFGVAIDLAGGRIYWANYAGSKISFANLDGSGGADLTIANATVNGPEGLAIDPVAGRLYWANNNVNKISFANLDGSGGADLNTTGATVNGAQGLAVDPPGGRVWWANTGGTPNKLSFANLDGSGGANLAVSGTAVVAPSEVAIDHGAGRIYWTDPAKISFANLDGSGGTDLNTSPANMSDGRGLAVDTLGGRVWWANETGPGSGDGTISSASLNGSGGVDLGTASATVNAPEGIALLQVPRGTGLPAITGGSVPGSPLSCSQGSWAPDLTGAFLYRAPQGFAFKWSRDGKDIAGASAATHTATVTGDYRCTVTASNHAGSSSQTSAPNAVLVADVSQYQISPRSFLAAGSGPSALPSKRKKQKKLGAKVGFLLNEAASVGFKVKQRLPGRKGKLGRCVKRTKANRKKRKCTRTVTLRGGFTRAGTAGKNSFRFTGRLNGRKLRPGRYVLVATPTANGKSGLARSTSFRIKRPNR